jgi:hypothetical protein
LIRAACRKSCTLCSLLHSSNIVLKKGGHHQAGVLTHLAIIDLTKLYHLHWLRQCTWHFAVRTGDLTAVERITSSPGFSPAQPVAATMLVEAVWCREPARMIALLLSKGVAPTGLDSLGCAALHGACARGDVAVVRALLDAGAAVNRQCVGGSTPLHHAAAFGRADVIR